MTPAQRKRKVMSTKSGERLATLEEQVKAQAITMEAHRVEDANTHAAMLLALGEIKVTLAKQRGFVAGVTFVVTAIAGAIAFAINYILGRPA